MARILKEAMTSDVGHVWGVQRYVQHLVEAGDTLVDDKGAVLAHCRDNIVGDIDNKAERVAKKGVN